MNPLDLSSIKYIREPKMIHKIKIQKIKTKIFILLALRALNKILDSLIYLYNFKILNTLKSLNVFRDKRLLVPVIINERYIGRIDNRSIIP